LNAAFLARRLGRLQQAITLGEYLIALDPASPAAHDELARAHMLAGDFDEAISEFRTALRLSPSLYWAHGAIGETLLLKGDASAALAEAQLEVDPMYQLQILAMANHALGLKAASDAALERLIVKCGRKCALDIATVLAYRGEADRSFEWLDKALQHHDLLVNSVAGHPTLASLYKDPRWLPFIGKIGMATKQLAAIRFNVKPPVEVAVL
jgi:tetratricopeptide (TPR) repeat protein